MVKWILRILAALFGVILFAWIVVTTFLLTPKFVTPHVQGVLQLFTHSKVSIKSVDLSLFDQFPSLTLEIDSLRITQTKEGIDDLLSAKRCKIAINPYRLLRYKDIDIDNITLRGAHIYMYVDSLHGPMRTFILPEEQQQTDTLSSFDISEYSLSLNRLKIDSTHIVIDDRVKQFYTRIENWGVDMSMDLSSTVSEVDVVSGFSNLIVWQKGDLLVKKTSMELRSQMLYTRENRELTFERANLRINDIDLQASGSLRRDTVTNGAFMDIQTSLNTPSLAEFLELIPSSLMQSKDKFTTQGEVLFDMDIKGLYSDDSYPTIGATLKVDNAKAKYESRKLELEKVDCDAYAFIDLNTPKESYADIRSLHINTSEIIDLNVSGKLTNIIEDAFMDINVKSDIDFDRFTEIFPLNDGLICKGTNSGDLNAKFKLSDVQNSNYADVYIDGESLFNNLEITFDASKYYQDSTALASLYMQAERGVMLFGDRVISASNSRTLRAKMNFQDINYVSKSGESLKIKDVELTAGANFDRETSKMNGIGVRGIAKNTIVGADSLFDANLESADILITIQPKTETRNAILNTSINSQQITLTEPNYDADVHLSAVDMKVKIERDSKTKELQIETKVNSQKISVNEPNYNSNLKLSSVNFDAILAKSEAAKWGMTGTMAFSDFWMLSDIFPMDINIYETSISMRNGKIFLDNAHLTIGESEIVATGNIKNLLRKIFAEPRLPLSGELAIHAPMLDFGALVEASNHSVLMMEAQEAQDSSIPQQDSIEIKQQIDETGSMFIVPKRMNFVFDLNIDKAHFWGSMVENFVGRATLDSGVLTLNKIELDAIGAKAVGSMVYRNINRKSSNLNGELKLKDVDINRIGELLPSVYTMMPMIESFEGLVDFDFMANANMDKNSMVDISTLYSAMRFKGRDLVLMDGETFTELSKKMMFKNKDRNMIDSLEAYALVAESRVDILPFLISIDRYSAVVGGSQVIDPETFDVDYNYHVSVMKSPLPFKAGVDIEGNLDDFDFRITKAKLKKTNFDEQRKIYEEYCQSINTAEENLADNIEAKREKLKAKRRAQRLAREKELEAENGENEEEM